MKMKDSIGDRMKDFYECRYTMKLTRRTPVIIRLDGKSFHTFTKKHCEFGFDKTFITSMDATAKYLLEEIQGAKISYVQSDEISILLTDYDNVNTEAWFDYNIQKMSSVSASMATIVFNTWFFHPDWAEDKTKTIGYIGEQDYGLFDSRCFNIPEHDIMNYFIWRQQDCIRNSLLFFARMYFSHNDLLNKNCNDIHELLYSKNLNWSTNLTKRQKNGAFFYRHKLNDNKIDVIEEICDKISYDNSELNSTFRVFNG